MLDWEQIIPELLDAIASGETVTKVLESRRLYRGDVFRKLLSEKWEAEYQAAREAGALARLEANTERLEALAEQNNPSKEKVNAARWAAANAQWLAERSDSKRWGREDRLKVQSVSAVRVNVKLRDGHSGGVLEMRTEP